MSDKDVQYIIERNKKVELDKAWETSWTRRLFIAVLTYFIAVVYMRYAGLSNPLLGAFVPTGGYLLSTLSLPILKELWLRNYKSNKELS